MDSRTGFYLTRVILPMLPKRAENAVLYPALYLNRRRAFFFLIGS